MPGPHRRPVGVVIRAAIVILVGAVLTILAALAVFASILLVAFGVENARPILFLSILALALSLIVLAAGIGLYNLRPWAWWLAVIALSVQILNAIGRYGLGWRPVFWENLAFLIPAFSLAYLVAVRRHFR